MVCVKQILITSGFLILIVICFTTCEPTEIKRDFAKVTWSDTIASIVFANCTPCHRPGQSGAFDLLHYEQAKNKNKLIRFVTQTRYMPPWPADPTYSHFIGERFLSQREIDLISEWVENDCPRGDSAKEPSFPALYAGSFFRKPDLVVRAEPVQIKGNGTDVFLIVKYPYQLDKDTLLDFVEFVPHQRKLVHHVNGHLVSYNKDRSFNYFSGTNIHADTRAQLIEVYNQMHIPYTDKKSPAFPTLTPNTVYYLPGYEPPVYPEEIGGTKLNKNGVFLINNLHFGPSRKDVVDSSYLNVFFRKTSIKRPISETQMGTFGVSEIQPEFVIPPNEIKTFHTQVTLSKTISMLSVNPHMHLVGKSFIAYALSLRGDTIPIIRIPKWDFRWQYYYTFPHPLKLEAGSTIHVYGTYDNTSKNPNNPFFPPRTITEGNGVESMKTTEEMFQLIFTYVPYRIGDEEIDLRSDKK